MKKKEVKNLIGRPAKYDPNVHLELLETVFKRGDDISAFCAEANISKKTFFYWQSIFPEFKERYQVVVNLAQKYWETLPLSDKHINFGFWSSIMKNRYKWGYCKMPKLTGMEPPLEIINLALKLYSEGEITDTQVDRLVNVANNKVKIVEHDTFEQRISKLETAYLNKERE